MRVRAGALAVAFSTVLLASCAPAPPPDAPLQAGLPRTESGAVPGPDPVAISPRRAAAYGAVLVSALLMLQYAHRRAAFILPWASGWLLIAPAMLLLARGYAGVHAARAAFGLAQLLTIATALLFFWSGDLYRKTGYVSPRRLRLFVPVAAWFLIAPLPLGVAAVMAPGYVISAALLAAAGAVYAAVLLEHRLAGAALIAFGLFGLAIANLASAWVAPSLLDNSALVLQIVGVKAALYAFGALGIHLLVFEDMTYELRITNRRLETARAELLQASLTDPLTGCHNRRFFDQVIDRELQRHTRFRQPLSILYVDVDRFKAVNDTLGHETGDRVLQHVAAFLHRVIREADYVFRWGGDEFLVLITCDGAEAHEKAESLRTGFDPAFEGVDLPPGLGLSVGAVEVPYGTNDLTPFLDEADRRMYEDKRART